MKRTLTVFLSISVFLLCSSIASAQVPSVADAESVHRENMYEKFRVERQIQQSRTTQPGVQITSPQPAPVDLDEKSTDKVFKLKEVVFDVYPKSIPRKELHAVTDRYTEMESVSIRDLYEMLTEIDSLFDKRHIVGRAVLPVQDVESGTVKVQIIEGKLGKKIIEVKRQPYPLLEGTQKPLIDINRPFADRFVRKRFCYPYGSVLDMKRLENEILRYNRTYRSQLLAELEPGNDLGYSNLKLTAVQPQPISSGIFCDNSGRESSGKIRTGMFIQEQSLLGLDESLFINYDKTEGTSNWYVFGDMPINTRGTSFEMSYSFGEPKTIAGPFVDLNITGESESYKPGLRQTLRNTKTDKSTFFTSVESYKSVSLFDDVVSYREKLTGYTLGFDNIHREGKITRYTSLSYVLGDAGVAGNPLFGGFVHEDFHLLRANCTQIWNPNKNWTWVARANGQLALSNLPQSQVFQIGGMATVRGAAEGLMSADSGYLISFEGRRYLFDIHKKGRVEGFGFIDHGGVFYRHYDPDFMYPSDFLCTIGGGLNINWSKYASATIGAGQPIFTAESHQEAFKDSLKHAMGYFSVRLQF